MTDCVLQPDGSYCPAPSDWSTCRPWDLTQQTETNCYIDDLTQEGLEIAGAQVNVWKLLGVHEQTKLVDLTGNGNAISGGDAPNFPASNAFTIFAGQWRSRQTGAAVTQSAYIGYDFGIIKISTGRQRYGIDTSIRHQITTIKIKQSSDASQRVTKARIERSDNGTQWYGVAVITLPDDDKLNQITFKDSAPSRYWRIRPLIFGGSTGCNAWGVQALELFDFQQTKQNNIQDKILLENRDRDYATTSVSLKGYYELLTIASELSRFGIEIPSARYQIRVNFNACVQALGRPIIIGDIIDLPSETQYTTDLRAIKRYLEVTDVTWDPQSYTPGWQPTMLLVSTEPAMATQETQDIFGDLAKTVDNSGLFNNDDGNSLIWQDYSTVTQTIQSDALTAVPERGSEGSNVVRQFEQSEIDYAQSQGIPNLNNLGLNPTGLYVEDAIPPNNEPFTESDQLPTTGTDGQYHRVVYKGLAKNVPARLYRWSATKGRWIYLETDRREQFNYQKEVLDEYLTSNTKISPKDIK